MAAMRIFGRHGGRRGQIAILAVVVVIAMCGFCAFAIDVMIIFLAQTQLQNAVDAASLAAATELVGFIDDDVKASSSSLATNFAAFNKVLNSSLHLDSNDIKFGYFSGTTKQFVPEEDFGEDDIVDSIWIRGRRTEGSIDGPISLFFGPIFGIDRAQCSCYAVATQPRRYVMFVMDRSGSMCYDTQGVVRKYTTRYTGSMYVENQDSSSVYAYGPDNDSRLEAFRNNVPGDVSSYAGWIWLPRYMLVRQTRSMPRKYGGTEQVTADWRHRAYFFARDKTTGAVRSEFVPPHVITQVKNESGSIRLYYWYWRNRRWYWTNYGTIIWSTVDSSVRHFRYAGKDSPASVQSGWMRIPADVNLYGGFSTESDALRGHYFWADSYGPVHGRCGYAVATQPVQPLQDSQDAAVEFINLLDHRKDRAGLATYGRYGSLELGLTDDWPTLIDAVQAYDPREATATGEGMEKGNDVLIDATPGYAQKIAICLTDGMANTVNGTYYDNYWNTVTFNGKQISCYIKQVVASQMETQAVRAANNGIRIYTVSFGENSDTYLAPEIADMTNAAFYYAAESEDLIEVFRDIFRRLPPLITQ